MGHIAVQAAPIEAERLLGQLSTPADGAVLLFCGIVRETNDDRPVSGLEYEAYEPMAEAVLREIVAEAHARWDTGGIAVVHRTGALDIGETSVAIAVASPHREAAYATSRYIIDELKRRVPVWKHEHYLDGEASWLAGAVPPHAGSDNAR